MMNSLKVINIETFGVSKLIKKDNHDAKINKN